MLTAEENEVLCRVGPGTPMGTVLRRYWTPAFQLGDLPTPDCPPVRVTILGENFVAFRDTAPAGFPRRAVLSPRRVARARPGRGLRHPVPLPRMEVRRGRDHHGDPQPRRTHVQGAGQARGLPGTRGRRARLGLSRAAGHRAAIPRVRLVHRGPRRAPRDRDDHGLQLDAGARGLDRLLARGRLAPGHARHDGAGPRSVGSFDFAGEPWDLDMPVPGRGGQGGQGQGAPARRPGVWPSDDNAPRIEVENTPFGFHYAAIRDVTGEPDRKFVRVTAFVMPYTAFIGGAPGAVIVVPRDDYTCSSIGVFPVPKGSGAARRAGAGTDPAVWGPEPDNRRIRLPRQDREAMAAGQFRRLPRRQPDPGRRGPAVVRPDVRPRQGAPGARRSRDHQAPAAAGQLGPAARGGTGSGRPRRGLRLRADHGRLADHRRQPGVAGPRPRAPGQRLMRVWIDQDYCTGSGLCELIEPRVFAIGDNGLARVRAAEVPPGCEDEVRDAAESCPGGCIRLEPRPLSRTYASFLPAPRKPADRGNAFSTRSAEKTISRTILQTIADNLRYVQGRLNTGSHRIKHFGTAARR